MLPTELRSFYAAARKGSFTAAAQVLNVSQPTVTTQIKELEARYGVELFHRRGRGVELTETGRSLLAFAQRIFANLEEACDFLDGVNGLQKGHLKIGAVGPYQVAEMLAAFHEHYPNIDVSVTFGNSQTVQDNVLNYRSDIAVLGQHDDHPQFFTLDYSRPEVVVVVHKDHPWSTREAIKISELAGQKMIRREIGSETRRALENALKKKGVEPKYVMEIGSKEGVLAAVAQGIGIGTVSEEEYIPDASLRRLKIAGAEIRMQVHVVCLSERQKARLIEPFLKISQKLAAERQGLDC